MTDERIKRINELAKKSREEGLSDAEKRERELLRREYIDAFRKSLSSQLDNVYIADGKGGEKKLEKKAKQ